MKKRLVMTILVLAAFWMMAVGSGSSDGTTKEVTDTQDAVTTEESEEAEADTVSVAIEEQVLINQDDIIITAKELSEDDIWGTGVKLLIENNSAADIGIG